MNYFKETKNQGTIKQWLKTVLGHYLERHFIDETFHKQNILWTRYYIGKSRTFHRQDNS